MVHFKAENLTFEYPCTSAKAIDKLSLEINKGEFVLLMGKTGSGKSTLLRLLVPEIAPTGALDGTLLNNAGRSAFVPQNIEGSFVSECVRGELAFVLENMCLDNDTISMKIGELASFFNLTNLLDRKISTLSGGEKSAVAIASAMIGSTDVLILDEPTAHLDSKAAYELVNLLKRVNDELGVTVIMSTHRSDGVIDKCDRLVVLDNGSVIFNDKPSCPTAAVLSFYPLCARLFDEHPLTVKEAIPLAAQLSERENVPADISQEIITLKNVTVSYDKRGRDVLDRLCFKAYKNKIHCIIGANGSGKTTLLKTIAGIKKQYSGKVRVDGRVAYLPQCPHYLFTKDTVGEEIDGDTAEKFDLIPYMSTHPYDLSGGEQQRLALAMLSARQYDILLLDEPTNALDTFYKHQLVDYLKSLDKTIIIVSHDLDFVGDVADYVSFLSDSVITADGERRQVLSSLSLYTTQLRRITSPYLSSAVSVEDLV